MTDEPPSRNSDENARFEYADWEDTLTVLNLRIAQDPTSADSWSNRGLLLKHLGDYQGAARDFRQALRLNPKSVRVLLWQGELYRELGHYSHSVAACNRAIALDPDRASSYYFRGEAYLAQGRHGDAIADFTKAAELRPNWSLPLLSRAIARSHDDIRDYPAALADYDSFFQLEDENWELIAEAHGLRASLYMELGLYREAIEDLSAELRLTPRDATAYRERSLAYERMGDHAHALDDWKMAIEINEVSGPEGAKRAKSDFRSGAHRDFLL